MPVTAKFQADFSDFDKGVAQADAKLGQFGASAGKAGGDLKQLAATAGATVAPFNTLHGSLSQFDGALAAAGIHIGPEVRALGELGDAAGKSAKDIGLLGVAGLSVAAALGGWKLGRMVAEFFELDTAIANATAKLLGWGDVAAETAGAKADVLARATATAKREITSYSEAIQINADEHKRRADIIVAATAEEKAVQEARWEFMKKALAEEIAADEKLAAFQDKLFGRDLITKASEYANALGGVSNVSKLMPAQQAEMNKALMAAIEALNRAGLGASETAKQFQILLIATTDWAAINAKVAASPDPFAAQLKARSAAFRDTQMQIMNLDQGITDSQLYWSHAGEIADESMKKAADAVKAVIPPTNDASNAVRTEFVAAFQDASGAADAMAAHVASVLGALTQTDAYRKAGFFVNEGFGTAGTINRNALAGIGKTIPGFATGGPVTKDGPIYAHAGEYVVPKGGGGGLSIMVAPGAIVINGQGAQAGIDAGEALIALLKSKGNRV